MSIIARIDYSHTFVSGSQTNGQVFIALFDAATNQPTNGNGITIYFTQNINGTIYNGQSIIQGQSAPIYTGLIQDTATNYHTAFYVTGQSTVPVPPPPVYVCDLAIANIVINNPESSPGSIDASITVVATTSYPAIQYSLNGTTWQGSSTFSGLSGGLKTVYVKDTNPATCLISSTVTIPILTNLLTTDPSITVGSNVSRWNAAFNPIVFTYQRKDFEVTAAANYSLPLVVHAGTTFTINGDMTVLVNLAAANAMVGPNYTPFYVYVKAGPYNGVYEVITATSNSVSVKVTFTATATGYMNSDNIRPYYKIITQIQYNDPITGQAYIVNSLNRSASNGKITANIATFLQSLLKAVSNSDYTQINYRDVNLCASYRIAYAESWDDGSITGHVSNYIQLSNTYYVTYTARQLGQKYGGNMAEFVPFPTKAATKWVTDFKIPAYSATFPFDLSFIYGDAMAGYLLYYKITLLDVNKNQLTDQSINAAYLLNEDGSFLLNTDGSRIIISENPLRNIQIAEYVGLNRLLIDFAFPDICYFFKIGVYYQVGLPSVINYSYTENPVGPTFTDGAVQIYDAGALVIYKEITASGSYTIQSGHSIKFVAVSTGPSTATLPQMTMTIQKNGVTVFARTISVPQLGVYMEYDAIADIGAVYTQTIVATDGGSIATPINIPDTTVLSGNPIQVVNDQIVRVDKNCDYNSVYLRWLGLTGSWNYYRFIWNQENTLDVQNATIIQRYVSDWENQESVEDIVKKSAGKKMQVHAEDMAFDDIKGCESMKYSPKVQMLVSKSPIKWQTIVINSATFAESESNSPVYQFAVTFNLPSINVQSQ